MASRILAHHLARKLTADEIRVVPAVAILSCRIVKPKSRRQTAEERPTATAVTSVQTE